MELNKKEAQKIADNYNLGKVKKVIYFPGGWENWNYKLETDIGKYVIQIVGGKFDQHKRKKLALQFKLLKYLKEKDFPYEIPCPIKSRNKIYLMNLNGKGLWVYQYIVGKNKKRATKGDLQEIARITATYHKYSKDFKEKAPERFEKGFIWVLNEYKRLIKRKPKTKIDKLFLDNAGFFIKVLKEITKIDYGKAIIVHEDLNTENVLFKKNKVVGVIDFNNVSEAPRVMDIAVALRSTNYKGDMWRKDKQEIFLKEYEKYIPLSKKEKSLIIPILLYYEIGTFMWYYDGMEKNKDSLNWCMNYSIEQANKLYKEWKKQKCP